MKSKRLFLWVLSIALILILCFVSPVTGKTARDIAKKAFPSVVMLVMEDSAGQPLSLGSGFFVRNDIVATNLHVIEGASGGYAKIVGAKPKYDITGYVAIDERRDLILLKIKDANAPVLRLGDSTKLAVGDEIFAVGNPQGLEGTFSKGIVSAIRTVGHDFLLQITAPISPGSSGGPVLDEQGKVIGVAVATFKGGQNLNFAIPGSYLAGLLSEIKPIVRLSAKTTPKQRKSLLDGFGGRSVEGVIGGEMRWSWRWHGPLAGGYSFSIHNELREGVKDVYCLVVFYDRAGKSIEADIVQFNDVIPGGLARRVTSKVHQSVQELTTPDDSQTPTTRIEFRILDFRIVESSEEGL